MALTPGTRLGVYEITARIGEGGMGQVYRATDTALDRHVAIKVLPESFALDGFVLSVLDIGATAPAAFEQPGPFVHFEDVTRTAAT